MPETVSPGSDARAKPGGVEDQPSRCSPIASRSSRRNVPSSTKCSRHASATVWNGPTGQPTHSIRRLTNTLTDSGQVLIR
jgi:hypothetical protein